MIVTELIPMSRVVLQQKSENSFLAMCMTINTYIIPLAVIMRSKLLSLI